MFFILVLQVLFGSNVTMAVQDPSYPVYMCCFIFYKQASTIIKNIIFLLHESSEYMSGCVLMLSSSALSFYLKLFTSYNPLTLYKLITRHDEIIESVDCVHAANKLL